MSEKPSERIKVIKRSLRVDEKGLFEAKFINGRVVAVKNINGCKVKNNEVILDYVENK